MTRFSAAEATSAAPLTQRWEVDGCQDFENTRGAKSKVLSALRWSVHAAKRDARSCVAETKGHK